MAQRIELLCPKSDESIKSNPQLHDVSASITYRITNFNARNRFGQVLLLGTGSACGERHHSNKDAGKTEKNREEESGVSSDKRLPHWTENATVRQLTSKLKPVALWPTPIRKHPLMPISCWFRDQEGEYCYGEMRISMLQQGLFLMWQVWHLYHLQGWVSSASSSFLQSARGACSLVWSQTRGTPSSRQCRVYVYLPYGANSSPSYYNPLQQVSSDFYQSQTGA